MSTACLGNQFPRFNTAPTPPGYSTDDAETAISFIRSVNYIPDEWQETVIRSWLRRDKHGAWCASTWCVTCARQNGKNGSLEPVIVYLMAGLNLKLLYTAHHLGTARKVFKRLMYFFGREVNDPAAKFPELNALVLEIRKTNGQEAIYLVDGGCIEVSARTGAAGRGSSFDVLIIDEAQEYEEDEQEALEPTISASESGDPVIIYLGTPPANISEKGAPFVRLRNAALLGEDKACAWVEWSAQGEVDKMTEAELSTFVKDRKNWADANPGLGTRLKVKTVEGECSRWAPRSFARERLNMWPTPVANTSSAFDFDKWEKLIDRSPDPKAPIKSIGLDMNPEQTHVSISVATDGKAEDTYHLELAADTAFSMYGISALVAWLWERAKRRHPVVIDAYSPARDVLEVPLKKRGLKVYILKTQELAQGYAMLKRAIEVEKTVSHFNQEQLNLSMEHAVREPLKNYPGAYKISKTNLEVSLQPAMATLCAFYGAQKFARKSRRGNKSATGTQSATIGY